MLTLFLLCSVGGINHPRERCWAWHSSHLLSLDIPTSPENIYAVLGFLSSICRSSPYNDKQVQYLSAVGLGRHYDRCAAHAF